MPTFGLQNYLDEQTTLENSGKALDVVSDRLAAKEQEVERATAEKMAVLSQAYDKVVRRNQLKADNAALAALQGGFVDSDIARQFTGAALKGASMLASGADLATGLGEYLYREDQRRMAAQAGKPDPYPDNRYNKGDQLKAFDSLSTYLDEAGQNAYDTRSYNAQAAQALSTPTGDIRDPLSWSLGKDPSLYGYVLQGADVGGQMAVPIGGALAKGKAASLAIGAAMGAGDQIQDTREFFKGKTPEQMKEFSGDYRNLLANNVPAEEAKQIVQDKAELAAGSTGALIGTVGGAATKNIFSELPKALGSHRASRILGTVATGAMEEGSQEVAEVVSSRAAANLAVDGNRDIYKDTFADATLGALGGGVTGIAGAANDERERNIKDAEFKANKAKADEIIAAAKVREDAVQSGNISTYLDQDPKTGNYSPSKAFSALNEHVTVADSQAKRDKAITSGSTIVKHFEDELRSTEENFSRIDPALASERQASLDAAKQELEVAKTVENPNPDTIKTLEDKVTTEQAKVDLGSNVPEAIVENYNKHISLLKDRVEWANQKQADLVKQVSELPVISPKPQVETPQVSVPETVSSSPDAITDLMATVAKKPDSADTVAVSQSNDSRDKLITLAMISPQEFNDSHIASMDSLVESNDSHLTNREKTFLRQFSAAKKAEIAAKSLGEVSQDIFEGSKPGAAQPYIGLHEYQRNFAKAVEKGATTEAQQALTALGKFRDRHRIKAEAINNAFDSVRNNKKPVQLVPTADGQWRRVSGLSPEAIKAKGGYTIHTGSSKLVNAVQHEAAALNEGFKAMNAALLLKRGQSNQTPQVRTQVSTQTGQEASNGQEVQTPETVTPQAEAQTEGKGSEEVASATTTEPVTEAVPSAVKVRTEDALPQAGYENLLGDVTEAVTKGVQAESIEPSTKGMLSAFKDKEKPSANWKGTVYDGKPDSNFLSTMFTQDPGKRDAGSFRPLVAIQNFLSKLNSGEVKPEQVVSEEISDVQRMAILDFKQKAMSWNKTVLALLPRSDFGTAKRDDFKFENPIYHFYSEKKVQVDGKESIELEIDENFLTAVSTGIYMYLLEQGNKPFNDDKTINKILGNSPDAIVHYGARRLLKDVGTRTDFITNPIGSNIIDALGIKDFEHTPVNELPRLKAALGALALGVMVKEGLLERTDVSKAALAEFARFDIEQDGSIDEVEADGEVTKPTGKETYTFFRIAKSSHPESKRMVIKPLIQNILKTNSNTQGVVSKLMGSEDPLKEPTFTPEKFTQKFAKRTKMLVPEFARKILDRVQKQKHELRVGPVNVFKGMDDTYLNRIVGIVNTEGMVAHKSKIEEQEAINEALEREVQMMAWFIDRLDSDKNVGDAYPPFFFKRSFWKPQRVGYAANVINMQTSKIHRYMISMSEWKTTISFKDKAKMEKFKLRVAEGLGVKTDKKANEVSIKEAQRIFDEAKDPSTVYGKAVAILQKFEASSLTDEMQEAIAVAVEKGKGNMHSLSSLIAIADYMNALSNPKANSFTTDIIGEVDGVTNGPMLSLMEFGAASLDTLTRGGFFSQASGYEDHNKWVSESGNHDLYEDTANEMLSAIKKLSENPDVSKIMGDVYKFTGVLINPVTESLTKNARDFIKNPLTTLMFGSSVKTTVSDMGDRTIDSIYGQLEEVGKSTGETRAVLFKDWKDSVNNLLMFGSNNSANLKLKDSMTFDDALVFEFSNAQESALKATFEDTIGVAIERALKSKFGTFIEYQKKFNDAARASFSIYRAAYEAAKQQEIDRLVATGEIATRYESNKPIHSLTHAQEKAIQAKLAYLLPTMNTLMSQRSEGTSAGLYLAKNQKHTTEGASDPAYSVQARFGQSIDGLNNRSKSKKDAIGTSPEINVETDPGVSALVLAIHSTDSAIALEAYGKLFALNIHDALGVGLDDVTEAAQTLNQNTFKALLEYSAPSEMTRRLEATIRGAAELVEGSDSKFNEYFQTNLKEWIESYRDKLPKKIRAKLTADKVIWYIANNMRTMAYNANKVKFTNLSQLGFVNQYSLEGGAYAVTDADRQKAIEALERNEVLSKPSTKTIEAIHALNRLLNSSKPVKADEVSNTNEEQYGDLAEAIKFLDMPSVNGSLNTEVTTLVPVKSIPSFKKLLNKRSNRGHADLIQFFEERKGQEVPLKDVLRIMYKHLRDVYPNVEDDYIKFQMHLINQLANSDASKIGLNYLTKDSLIDSDAVPENIRKDVNKIGLAYYFRTIGNNGLTDGLKEKIYLFGQDFQQSDLTYEVILHEAIHAMLVKVSDDTNTRFNFKEELEYTDPVKGPILNELHDLLGITRQYINKHHPDNAWFDYAVSNLDEFIAIGMTNQDFQDKVLKKIKYVSKNDNNEKQTAMSKFISLLTKFVFGDNSKKGMETGMYTLISNVSALMKIANESADQVAQAPQLKAYSMPAINQLNTSQMFDAIGSVGSTPLTVQEQNHLRGLIRNIVNKVRTPFEIYEKEQAADPAMSPQDRFVQTMVNGRAFVSSTLAAGFRMSAQTAFVLEQVEAVVSTTLDSVHLSPDVRASYKTLERVYKEARHILEPKHFHEALTGYDWANATPAEQLIAKEQYDYVFTETSNVEGRSDAVSRFAAMALTIPGFKQMLDFASYRTEKRWKDMHWPERIREAFTMALTALGNLISGQYSVSRDGQSAHLQIASLVDKLVAIDDRRRPTASNRFALKKIETGLKHMREAGMAKVSSMASSPMIANSRFTLVRAVGNTAKIVAEDRVNEWLDSLQQIRDRINKDLPGTINGIFTELRSLDDQVHDLILAAGRNEQDRKHIKDGGKANAKGAFINDGEDLTEEHEKVITEVFLHSDVTALLDQYSLADIERMLADSGQLQLAINAEERRLYNDPNKAFYIRQAKDLGFHLVTGLVRNPHLLLNAGNIARRYGADNGKAITESHANNVEKIIDRLTSLYALAYTNSDKKLTASQLMRKEASRTDGGNGIEYTLKLHKALQQQSLDLLFRDSKAMMMKGYTPQLYNEGTEICVADIPNGQALLDQGWVRGGQVTMDKVDNDQSVKHIYVLPERGLRRYVSGAVSNTGTNSRGKSKHGNIYDPLDGSLNPYARASHNSIMYKKRGAIRDLDTTATSYEPDPRSRENFLVPVFNARGEVVNHRYLMNSQTKNNVLERDLSFSTVLGAYSASIFDKVSSAEQNRKVLEVLKQQYDAEHEAKPHSFLEVSANSTIPELKNYWNLLPKAAKQAAKDIWGDQPIKVRADLAYQVFGYRKRSISEPFDKSVNTRTNLERVYVKMVEGICTVLGQKQAMAGIRVRQFEDIWQEVVAEAKDILVVKTGVTLFWNMVSNITQLWWMGVSPVAIVQHTRTALIGAIEYRAESKELQRLKAMRDSGYITGNAQELDQAIVRLEDSIARNPARELIEAGLLPTIVEDVSLSEDPYSYKSKLQGATKKYTDKIPNGIKTVARYGFMTHDTPMYKILSQGTQLSDFVARYALYQHLTTREEAPMAKQDAIRKASDVFVNYDVPSHPNIQYLNDSGIFMFTKYYLRIQRTLMEQWRENPARALVLMAAGDYFDGFQTILDASGYHSPFEAGAFKIFDAWDEGMVLDLTKELLPTD